MTNRRGQAALFLTNPQIELVLIAINRLKIEMSEPGMSVFTGSQVRAIERAESELLRAQSTMKTTRKE